MSQESLKADFAPVRFAGHSRPVPDRFHLCWLFAVLEGAAAALTVVTASFSYHLLVLKMPIAQMPLELHGLYALVVGAIYGSLSAGDAARYLDKSAHPQAILGASPLGWTAAFAIALLLAFLAGEAGELSRVSLTSSYVAGLPVLLGLRSVSYRVVAGLIGDGSLQYQAVSVVGRRADVIRFIEQGDLRRNGYRVLSTFYLEDIARGADPRRRILEHARSSLAEGAGSLIFVGSLDDIEQLECLVADLNCLAIDVAVAPATGNAGFKFIDVLRIGPNNSLRIVRKPMSDLEVFLKRSMDLLGAGLGLVLLAPLFLLVAVAIKLDSPGPVFFRQARRGFNGEVFEIWKFRSMMVMESGYSMTQVTRGDARLTRLGRLLRATNIDELPQLLNVLRGDMSLVGPRPHAVAHDDQMSAQLSRYAHRHRIKPGITGWAQVNGYRGDTSRAGQAEGRVAHDLYYVENWSLIFDAWILAVTVLLPKSYRNAV